MTQTMTAARRWLDSDRVTQGIKVIAVLSLLISLTVGVRQFVLTNCLAAYNEAVSVSTNARTSAAEADRQALDDMIKRVATARHSGDQKAIDEAFSQYLQARAFANGQRASNPLPAPPSQMCS